MGGILAGDREGPQDFRVIVSASRRTDLAAHYADWLIRRLRAGWCAVANPRNPKQSSRVSLLPEDVDVLVLWTRDAGPLLPHLDEMAGMGHRFYFQYTALANPISLDPGSPSPQRAIAVIRALAEALGPERVVWRYDPIVLGPETDHEFHRTSFARLASALRGHVRHCVVSLLDDYRKTRARMRGITTWPAEGPAFEALLRSIAEAASGNGMDIAACAEPVDLAPYGIRPGRCVDPDYIRRVFGREVTARKDPTQREACGCVVSRDIGAYDTCPSGCLYCYASSDFARAREALRRHDPDAPALVPEGGMIHADPSL
jgi:hypothetical protein